MGNYLSLFEVLNFQLPIKKFEKYFLNHQIRMDRDY